MNIIMGCNFSTLAKRKCIFLAAACVFFFFGGKAQNADQYSFAAVAGTYTSIVGQTGVGLIPTIHGDDQVSNGNVPFQFSFDYCGHSYTGFRVCSNGWVSFNSTMALTTPANSLTNMAQLKPVLMPLWDNLTGVPALSASALFITTGTAPNRIFTYECNNWGWNNNATSSVISFQIKLYETTNVIEFIYRQESGNISTPASATIGIGDGNTTPTFLTLDNTTANPTTSNSLFTTTLSTRPATGQVYRFTPPPPCNGAPPPASVTPAGPINICVAAPVSLTSILTPPASGVSYQWEESATGTAPWTAITNATNSSASFNPITSNYYRLITTCTATGQTNTSNVVQVNVAPPVYATIPYLQDFETWTSYCDNSDIPQGSSTTWRNTPATGDASWRREDQGSTANWSSSFGGYFPASRSGSHSASFSSSSVSNSSFGNVSGDLDLYLDCSSVAGDKALYFYYINQSFGFGSADSLRVFLSTDGGTNFSQIGVFDTADNWKQFSLPIQSDSAQTIVRLSGYVNSFLDFTDLGVDSLYIALPCTGAPAAGIIANTNITCAGGSYTFSPSGTSMAGNLSYIWEQSVNGGNTWTTVPGAITQTYTTPALYDTIMYRMIVICNGSSLSDTTNEITLNIVSPQYAATPFTESFESWINNCSVSDVPSLSWVNSPSTGDNSWRREDEGITAWSFLGGDYSPAAKHLNHSARFHSWNTIATGNLELFVDCSSAAGGKELQFYYINPSSFQDSLRVSLSTDGGLTFTSLASYADVANWTLKILPFTNNSPHTVFRFQGIGDGSDDMGIDYVRVLNPCTGAPVAGTVDSVKVCAGQNFDLSLTGTSASAGLTYQWQSSPDNITWTNVINGNAPIVTTTVMSPTYFRAIVTCSNSNLSDTSASQFFDIAPFYLCYCVNVAQSFSPEDIGNVTIRRVSPLQTVLSNGSASPLTNNTSSVNGYTDYTGIAAPSLNQGAAYNFRMTAITQDVFFWGGDVAFYIDMDRDGTFNPTTEKVAGGSIGSNGQFNGTFIIPITSQMGITGMRVVMESLFGNPDPCNPPSAGEVEDYLVNIDLPICTGPLNAGNAILIDTSVCVNQPFMVIDTNHEKQRSSAVWIWQSSPDNSTWTDIAGTNQQDTLLLNAPMTNTYYRLKMTCISSNDVTYSTEALLKIKPAYFCYCESYADGGAADLSDLGAFSIGTFVVNGGGPHLSNPGATSHYTTNDNLVTLYLDSTYSVNAYHIIKDANQQDAKVTLFIDFDNNFVYDLPSERVWTGFTNSSNVFISSTVAIPSGAVKNVLTGMRLILNNDTNPNTPSDEACGTYTSGETEDYVVMLRDKNDPPSTSVPEPDDKMSLEIFPNPTDGIFNLKFVSYQPVEKLNVRITDVTGKEIVNQQYYLPVGELIKQVDLQGYDKGLYMVEIAAERQTITRKLIIK